jgi:arsenate reductase
VPDEAFFTLTGVVLALFCFPISAGGEFEALSAGIEPKDLNPLAVEAMREIGIDISQQKSKDVRDFLGQAIPYVITVCDSAKGRCPIFPRTFKFLHWSFADPAEAAGSHDEKLTVFRRVRDEIANRIQHELVTPRTAATCGLQQSQENKNRCAVGNGWAAC